MHSEAIPEITLARSEEYPAILGPGEVGGEHWPGFCSRSDGRVGVDMILGKVWVVPVGEMVGAGGVVEVESDGVEGEEEEKYFQLLGLHHHHHRRRRRRIGSLVLEFVFQLLLPRWGFN